MVGCTYTAVVRSHSRKNGTSPHCQKKAVTGRRALWGHARPCQPLNFLLDPANVRHSFCISNGKKADGKGSSTFLQN
eukprot:jgi/Botrbrau1/4197/Bobra.0044s0002.1